MILYHNFILVQLLFLVIQMANSFHQVVTSILCSIFLSRNSLRHLAFLRTQEGGSFLIQLQFLEIFCESGNTLGNFLLELTHSIVPGTWMMLGRSWLPHKLYEGHLSSFLDFPRDSSSRFTGN